MLLEHKMFEKLCRENNVGQYRQTFSNQSGAWYAEAVDRAVIKKHLKKFNKTLQGFKDSSDGGQGEYCPG